jgi:ribose transport system substrate-binding protein
MLNAVLANNPAALCLAALDTGSVTEQLKACLEKGIPVIGFDSGVPNAPEGAIKATASTSQEAAGALAAEGMFSIPEVRAAIDAATPENPIILSKIAQDVTSASITGRTIGYINRMFELVSEVHPGAVAITGHDLYLRPADGPVAVEIEVTVLASSNITDSQAAAQSVLAKDNVVGIFCSNTGSMDGLLAATADGSDLDRENGKYKDLYVIGFDAGALLKNAVRQKWLAGAIAQDPYMIGYLAVELAVKALNGEELDAFVDTGCHFYTSENMDDPVLVPLLYD